MSDLNIFTRLSPAKPTAVYDTFWRFAAKRQASFFGRIGGGPPPWTDDPIIEKYKFTNAYRACDRTSQFLIRNVIYQGHQSSAEIFFRCILFKIFNRMSTWALLTAALGEIAYSTFSPARCNEVLVEAKRRGTRIFSAAYIMPSRSGELNAPAKHRNYLALLMRMMAENLPIRVAESKSMGEAFQLLLNYPLIGNFLAYQFVTDINYSRVTDFSEMEFVVPGPGARDGIRKCFSTIGDFSESDIIRFVTERQHEEFARLGLDFQSLWGRPLQLIDCQNLFCEVGKYARLAHPEIMGVSDRTRIKQKFTPNSQPIHYWFPPKWGLNDLVEQDCRKRMNIGLPRP